MRYSAALMKSEGEKILGKGGLDRVKRDTEKLLSQKGLDPAKVDFTLHDPDECTLRWSQPGRPLCSRRVKLPDEPSEGGVDVTIGE